MTEIRFYHLERTTLEGALPAMLKKVLERGQRALVRVGSAERVEALANHLWVYNPASFLPHGTTRDGRPDRQPIWIDHQSGNPNKADILFLADGAEAPDIAEFTLCVELFDGNDDDARSVARTRWNQYREAGLKPGYYQQTDKGWEQKS